MKIEVRTNSTVYIENGDYTYYLDFSIEGETILSRYLTDEDDDCETPMFVWEDGSDAVQIF